LRTEPVTLAIGAALALAIGGAGGVAVAADVASVAASLDVAAPAACTTREEVAARIAARSSRIRLRAGGGAGDGPALRATITPGAGGAVVAELTIVQAGGGRSLRRLTARSCADAADAVALVIVIALDPTSLAAGEPAPADAAAPPAPLAEPPAPATSSPATPPLPTPPRSPSPPPPAETVVDSASPEPPPAPAYPRYGAGAFGTVVLGPAPDAMVGFGIEVSAALERESIWSPALVLRGMHAWKDGVAAEGGIAAFTLDALALDACPLRLRVAILAARACGAGLLGRLTATGTYTYSPGGESPAFATLGGAVILTVDLGPLVTLSGRLGLGASLTRYAFAFSPVEFHRVPQATVAGDVGVGVRFP
jgi:hypothetical protein